MAFWFRRLKILRAKSVWDVVILRVQVCVFISYNTVVFSPFFAIDTHCTLSDGKHNNDQLYERYTWYHGIYMVL